MTGYNADIICLQEVDRKVFMNELFPTFDVQGFNGAFQVKAGTVLEGEATFYRKSKFRFVLEKTC